LNGCSRKLSAKKKNAISVAATDLRASTY
jgi:hypothetical protein